MRLLSIIAVFLSAVALTTQAGSAKAGPVAWEALAQSPGGLSAVATGIEMLGSCKVPLVFEQSKAADDAIHVTITCANTGDGAGSVVVKFVRFPGRQDLFATGFEFLG